MSPGTEEWPSGSSEDDEEEDDTEDGGNGDEEEEEDEHDFIVDEAEDMAEPKKDI